MKRIALIASIAFTAGLAGPAFAQDIGGVTVSAEDWPYVEEYCATLSDDGVAASANEEPSSPAQLTTTTIDLSTVTYADCDAAGLTDPGNAGGLTEGGPMENRLLDSPDD